MTGTPVDHRILTSQEDKGRMMAIVVEENRAMCHQRSNLELLFMVKWWIPMIFILITKIKLVILLSILTRVIVFKILLIKIIHMQLMNHQDWVAHDIMY
jgi:hypothetical protein